MRRLRVGLLALVCAAALPASAEEQAAPTPRLSSLTLGDMVFVESIGERNEMVLRADTVHLPPGSDQADLEGVFLRMDDPEGAPEGFEMHCERGQLSLTTSDFRAEGDVRGRTGDGRLFYTTWVKYDSERGLLSTNAPVRIVEGIGTIMGNGFRYDVRRGSFALTGGARIIQE